MATNVGEIRAKLVLSNDEFKRKMQESRDELKRTSFSSQQLSKDFGMVQKASMAVGGAVVAAIGGSVKVAADFEQSMAKVRAISGSTAEEFARQEKAAREMGATTIFSASEAAEALTYLAMAGFDVDQQIGSLPAVLNAAIAGTMSLGDSANIVTNIMSAFGLTAEESAMAVDVLAKAANSANTDIPLMGEAMKMVGPVANALGWSIHETAAAIGELGNVGIAGSQAGTVLRASLISLANPTGQTAEVMKELGIEVMTAEGNMKSLPELIGHISDRFEGLTDAQKTQAAAQLVGREAAAGFIALLEVGEKDLASFTRELENSAGVAQEMADIQGSTLIGAFKELESAVEEVAIALGNEFIPPFKEIVLWAAEVISSFDEVEISQIKTALAFGGTAAAIGLTISIIGKLAIAIKGLYASMGPAGWLIAGLSIVGGLIAANMVKTEESVEVNLEHARSLEEESKALETQIDRYDALAEKNRLTNEEMAEFVDLQSLIAMETDAEKIAELQQRYDELQNKSGLSNKEMSEFLSLNDSILQVVPNSNTILSEQGNVLLANTDAAKAYNEQLERELELELKIQANEASQQLADNIKERKEALEELNKLAEKYVQNQEDIINQEQRLLAAEMMLQKERETGDETRIKMAEEKVKKEEDYLTLLEEQGYRLGGQILEQEEIINNIELQILKGQEAYQELINYRLAQAGVNAEKGKEIEAIDEAISKTKDLIKEAKNKYTVDGQITEEGQTQIDKYNEQIKTLESTRSEVQRLKRDQDRITDSIDDSVGSAQDLNYEMEKEIEKHLKQVGYTIQDAKNLNSELEKPIEKRVTIWERIKRLFSGGNDEKRHQGGIVGTPTRGNMLPKMHVGGTVNERFISRLQNLPQHNEIDVRLLNREMVLTEGQQSQLWRMIETGFSGRNTNRENNITRDDINRLIDAIYKLASRPASFRINGRELVEEIASEMSRELEKRNELEGRKQGVIRL